MSPHGRALLLLTLLKCVFGYPSCGEERNVFAVEGENVILPVEEEEVTEVSWVINSAHVASTKPDNTIDVKTRNYKSKLYSEKHGSLGIKKINMADQGTYTATVFKQGESCTQSYHLTVYSYFSDRDLQIDHNMTGDDRCFITCVVKKPNVATTWISAATGNKETTSTLHLDRTGMNVTWVCSATNNLINASRIVQPWTICDHGLKKYKTVTTVVLCVLLVILGTTCAYCLKKKVKTTQCSICKTKTQHVTPTEDFLKENVYYEIQSESPAVTTRWKNKEAEGQEETQLKTIYATATISPVTSPYP